MREWMDGWDGITGWMYGWMDGYEYMIVNNNISKYFKFSVQAFVSFKYFGANQSNRKIRKQPKSN